MKKSLNTRLIFKGNFLEKVQSAAIAGFPSIELWIDDLDRPLNEAKKILQDYNIKVSSLEKIDGWFEKDRGLMNVLCDEDILAECRRRLEIAAQLECPYLICCPSFSHRGFHATIEEGLCRFNEIIDIGSTMGVEPLIEFMGQTEQINTYGKCLDFLNKLGRPARMVVDAYHIWRGGDSMDVLSDVDITKIGLLHVSDAQFGISRTNHRDRDRVMPGDGQIDLKSFFHYLQMFQGDVAVGVYNPIYWNGECNSTAIEAFDKVSKYV
jgi:2-keto-myo-inositol isomerase